MEHPGSFITLASVIKAALIMAEQGIGPSRSRGTTRFWERQIGSLARQAMGEVNRLE